MCAYRNKQVPQHRLNQKADRKLDYLATIFSGAAEDQLSGNESRFLSKRLTFKGFYHLEHLDLEYTYENRFWSFNYNITYHTRILDEHFPFSEKWGKGIRLKVFTSGKMEISDAEWVLDWPKKSEDPILKACLNRLNNPLIIDRIVSLDLSSVELIYLDSEKKWDLKCSTLIGSTTWIMIPPMMQLIKPTISECIRLYEFVEMTLGAVRGCERAMSS